jgi:hypothetical protein
MRLDMAFVHQVARGQAGQIGQAAGVLVKIINAHDIAAMLNP